MDDATRKQVIGALDYNPKTGVFTWLRRPENTRSDKAWNTRMAGKVAGHDRGDGYLCIIVAGKRYRAHRLAWLYVYGRWPRQNIDHINQEKADNRIANLRECTHAENCQNKKPRSDNTSGCPGVFYCAGSPRPWRTRVTLNQRHHHIGYFATRDQAAKAYVEAKKRLHSFAGPVALEAALSREVQP